MTASIFGQLSGPSLTPRSIIWWSQGKIPATSPATEGFPSSAQLLNPQDITPTNQRISRQSFKSLVVSKWKLYKWNNPQTNFSFGSMRVWTRIYWLPCFCTMGPPESPLHGPLFFPSVQIRLGVQCWEIFDFRRIFLHSSFDMTRSLTLWSSSGNSSGPPSLLWPKDPHPDASTSLPAKGLPLEPWGKHIGLTGTLVPGNLPLRGLSYLVWNIAAQKWPIPGTLVSNNNMSARC